MNQLALIFVSVAAVVMASSGMPSLTPDVITPTAPVFPQAFTISFQEVAVLGSAVLSENTGSWYYDFSNHRARFDHDEGQVNNFCGRQGLSPKDSKANCSLIFTPTDDMYVHYPVSMTCCRLCGKDEGCTILKPNWLQTGSKLLTTETINGVKCYGWGKPGAVAAEDTWYADFNGTPCRYHEVVLHIDHNLTFVPSTLKIGSPPDYIFDVPEYCNRTCPLPYHPPHN